MKQIRKREGNHKGLPLRNLGKRIFSFPRAGVGTHSRRANVAGPQAQSVPTPARGNQKPEKGIAPTKFNRFPRRRVGTRNHTKWWGSFFYPTSTFAIQLSWKNKCSNGSILHNFPTSPKIFAGFCRKQNLSNHGFQKVCCLANMSQ